VVRKEIKMNHEDLDQMVENWVSKREKHQTQNKNFGWKSISYDFLEIFYGF